MTLRIINKYFLVISVLVSYYVCGEEIRVRGVQSEYDASHDYYIGLIKLAYSKLDIPLTISEAPFMVQKRALDELKSGRLIDIYWAGSNAKRELELGFISIPLIKGLLGYRVLITSQKKSEKINDIKNINDLSTISLCQGMYWPDTDILLAAGLDVFPTPIYENMFKLTRIGRCDAFPRGINEGYAELNARKKAMPELTIAENIIIYYPFPMYFFTKKENTTLINNLKKGLEVAIDDGSFDDYIQNHITTKHLFPLTKWNDKVIIELKNPFLSEETDYKNTRYWLNLAQQ